MYFDNRRRIFAGRSVRGNLIMKKYALIFAAFASIALAQDIPLAEVDRALDVSAANCGNRLAVKDRRIAQLETEITRLKTPPVTKP